MQWFLVRPTSYFIPLTFKCQSTAVVLVIPTTVAERVLWNRVSLSFHCAICLGVFLELDHEISVFRYGVRNPYEVVCNTQILWENFLYPKIGETGQKSGFFNLKFWMRPIWSLGSDSFSWLSLRLLTCISRMSRYNDLMYCMLVKIHAK